MKKSKLKELTINIEIPYPIITIIKPNTIRLKFQLRKVIYDSIKQFEIAKHEEELQLRKIELENLQRKITSIRNEK